ncbi:unnamed protein product [Tuber aestivum]|uniref:BTB domain-containing protein n=1 Tax=Tuber aestivum TaxID=59557 RepID=A0A292Q115_9PEZI|nr:unnamed protein product [Tuber aestivum]
MPPSLYPKPVPNIRTTKNSPKYKDFLFSRTVTLYVGPHKKRMEIHKKLLASVSRELNKHVNNDMREGIEGIICLPDEEEETIAHFAEWAYTREYALSPPPANTKSCTEPRNDPWSDLHKHLQVYVFSDKFNIRILMRLAESKFHSEINRLNPNRNEDVVGLVELIDYAYDNLPTSDPILKFLTQYASWKLELLRPSEIFHSLMLDWPDFLNDLLMNLKGPSTKPVAAAQQAHQTHYRAARP